MLLRWAYLSTASLDPERLRRARCAVFAIGIATTDLGTTNSHSEESLCHKNKKGAGGYSGPLV
jgi:hypothetical protein